LSPYNIDCVIITPLKAYATANIPLFRNAGICISRRDWIEDSHAPRCPANGSRQHKIPNDVLGYLEIEYPEKLRLLGDFEEILPDLRARWVGVHHRSSLAVEIQTERGIVVATDAALHEPS
jgi:hypothetical protein